MLEAGVRLAGRVRRREAPLVAAERWVAREEIERLDVRLAELARGEGRARLALGELLDALGRHGGHHELGFSSLEAYARERCGRGGRWASETRTVARRLRELPALRAALASGAIGWCMAELVARQATPETDAELTRLALGSTVRAMREHFARVKSGGVAVAVGAEEGAGQMSASSGAEAGAAPEGEPELLTNNRVEPGDLEPVTVSFVASQQDAWLFEWTRRFAAQAQGEVTDDQVVGALLAEAYGTFGPSMPANDLSRFEDVRDEGGLETERKYRALRAEWRAEAERRCEANIPRGAGGGCALGGAPGGAPRAERLEGVGARELDARILEAARGLSAREVELARVARRFHRAEGWLRLGYSSEEQYARERLGLSVSSYKAKIALAGRWGAAVRGALERGELGYESALLVSRVADRETERAWIARAQERTVKHLAEEVRVAELVRGVGGAAAPPSAERVAEVHALESRILAGDRDAVLEARSQMSARFGVKPGTVRIDLHLTRDTARFWRTLGDVMRKHLPRGMSFVAFLCECFWESWQHLTVRDEKWAEIYGRDRYTCQNPCCSRRDVTCHHIVFRSAGGGDEPENLVSLCTWCHLEGVHRGLIRVTRAADGKLRWVLGRDARMVVDGRVRRDGSLEVVGGAGVAA